MISRKEIAVLLTIAIIISISACVQQKENNIKKFSSEQELNDFVKSSQSGSYYGGAMMQSRVMTASMSEGSAIQKSAEASDFSTTNIQVEGVDEADIIKNDGKYIYTVSGNKVEIIDAYPAESAKIISQIEINGSVNEIFINGDRLVVFGYENKEIEIQQPAEEKRIAAESYPYRRYAQNTFIKVYDLSEKTNPILAREMSMEGSYYDSRMIGDYVYAVITKYANGDPVPLPMIMSNEKETKIAATDVYYFDYPDSSYQFTNIISLNVKNNEEIKTKTFLLGYTQNMFVSQNNIYITYQKRMRDIDYTNKIIDEVVIPLLPANIEIQARNVRNSNLKSYEKMSQIGKIVENYFNTASEMEKVNLQKAGEEKMKIMQSSIAKEMEKTIIHKIAISNGDVEYKTQGEAPGNVLNQFSMDEYNNYFRIATTTQGSQQMNHIYVLDSDMKIVGKLEDLAPGERIYSARFIGDRAYLVTFKKVDPLFVIDLKEPANPKVLGKLKIPGYSDYLHPYDENHIIGIGKEAVEAKQGDFAWYQGMKLALFDVTDVENPKEISKYVIGDRGTDSEALREHKAFLFSKSKNLLVMPVQVYEIKNKTSDWGYGEFTFQGAYVFNLDTENGFVLKGKITHRDDEAIKKEGSYPDYRNTVRRSLYIGDVLYTLSSQMIKMNSLDDIKEIGKIDI